MKPVVPKHYHAFNFPGTNLLKLKSYANKRTDSDVRVLKVVNGVRKVERDVVLIRVRSCQ
jgi:hypothetical protein